MKILKKNGGGFGSGGGVRLGVGWGEGGQAGCLKFL